MTMADLAVVILTRDEELNLPHCLRSVEGLASQVFVVDSGSQDATVSIAREFGAQVFEHPFENQAQQFNWALDHLPIGAAWILRLDADEYLLPELRNEIETVLSSTDSDVTGFVIKRRVVFQGRWIRHGGYYPTWLLRLFRTGCGRSEDLEMDEHIVLSHGRCRRLAGDFVDHNRKGLRFWATKHTGFAEREARVLGGEAGKSRLREPEMSRQAARRRWMKNRMYRRMPLLLRPFIYFAYRYFIRLGFLDGREGLVFHVLQGFCYRFYVDATMLELRSQGAAAEMAGARTEIV
jgi:glycosyltransferase involved in cell wall biosynthesis